jgi:hypothetical protein
MSEQVYTGIHFFTTQSAEARVGEKLAKAFEHFNATLERMYQNAIDTMADMVIRRLDL